MRFLQEYFIHIWKGKDAIMSALTKGDFQPDRKRLKTGFRNYRCLHTWFNQALQLSIYLSAEAIFRCLAEILTEESDFTMASTMVQCLNTILLTSTEIFELRSQPKELSSEA
ncbi:protein vac14 homolog [Plakobranchus ocellatus]|uniref:Protein vac14 homolog n=1 Tax=Plakobranchus ocellatus TaxID=259542 RepID=A0AAV3YS30_9GAST|nr:protein vac14 homolog [Plakobranchus ocellatus]